MKKITHPIFMALVWGLGVTGARATSRETVVRGLAEAPLCFEVNRGQAGNTSGFIAHGTDCTVFISATDASLSVEKSGKLQTVCLNLIGANPRAKISGVDELPGRANYFIGADSSEWRTGIPLYSRVRLAQVYPGIDVVYYADQSARLEYDFLLQPGADPKQISLRITGADNMRLDESGNLILKIGGEEIRQHKPVIYQTINGVRKEIAGGYKLTGKATVSFWLGEYDRTLPLVIDPLIVTFSSYLAGKNGDSGWDIACDANGNVYICGDTLTPGLATSKAARTSYGGTHGTSLAGDAFVAKFVPDVTNVLTLSYLTYLGGSGQDSARGIAADDDGNAYVTGFTDSPNFPTQNAVYKKITGLNNTAQGLYRVDAFVTKINSNGTALVYSTYLGGGERDSGNAIAVDAAGSAYVAGFTESFDFPVVINRAAGATRVVQKLFGGIQDAFVTKFSPAGTSIEYSTYLGGAAQDSAQGVAVDTNGDAYLTGYTLSPNFPLASVKSSLLNGFITASTNFDAFFTKISANGATNIFSTYLGGTNTDVGMRLAVKGESAYVTGYTFSKNFPATEKAANTLLAAGASSDVFVTKFSPTNIITFTNKIVLGATNQIFSTNSTYFKEYSVAFGGKGSDEAMGIAVDDAGEACIAGFTFTTNFFGTNAFADLRSVTNVNSTTKKAFVVKLSADASVIRYGALLGGKASDAAHGVALDPLGDIYLVGGTTSSDFPRLHSIETRPGGNSGKSDVFVAALAFQITDTNEAAFFAPRLAPMAQRAETVNSTPAPIASPATNQGGDFELRSP